MWNRNLIRFANEFQRRHGDISTAVYDTCPIFNAVMNNPRKYGFKDAVSQCLESDCMWFDDLHPSYGVHRILAANLVKFLHRL